MSDEPDHGPDLDGFLAAYEADDNEWWRTAEGQHQNWFEDAVDRWRAAEAEVDRLRAEVERLQTDVETFKSFSAESHEALEAVNAEVERLQAENSWMRDLLDKKQHRILELQETEPRPPPEPRPDAGGGSQRQ